MTGPRRAGPGSHRKRSARAASGPPGSGGLVPLGLPDLVRGDQHLLGTLCRDEQHAVVISEDDVPGADQVRPEPRGDQRLGLPLVQPHRPGRVAAVAEDRKADRGEFRRVAVQAPHHQARHPGGLGLQDRQVADAGLVQAAAVVDDQHVAGFGPAKCLQEHIHAAVVPPWQDPPGDPLPGHDRPDSRMGGPQRNTTAQAGIGHQRRGQIRERLQHGDLPGPAPGTAAARVRAGAMILSPPGQQPSVPADGQKPPHVITRAASLQTPPRDSRRAQNWP